MLFGGAHSADASMAESILSMKGYLPQPLLHSLLATSKTIVFIAPLKTFFL